MRYTLLYVCFAAAFSMFTRDHTLYSQTDSLPAFNSFRTPTSPAYVLLGVEPTSVERPNTPSALAVSILNNTNNLSGLPKDYALEMAPFWLFGHPDLTWQKDTTRNVEESIMRTITLSAATAEFGDSGESVTSASVALRMSIVSGQMTRQSQKNLEKAVMLLGEQGTLFHERLQRAMRENNWDVRKKERMDSAKSEQEKAQIAKDFVELEDKWADSIRQSQEYQDAIQSQKDRIEKMVVVREGWSLETALGVVWDFPGAIADSGKFHRLGFWITPSYQAGDLSVVGVLRYLHDQDSLSDIYDIGARIIFTGTLYALSIETVHRTSRPDNGNPDQFRLAGVFNYKVQDGVWLNATFGKNYDSRISKSFLAQIGLSFDFGKHYSK